MMLDDQDGADVVKEHTKKKKDDHYQSLTSTDLESDKPDWVEDEGIRMPDVV